MQPNNKSSQSAAHHHHFLPSDRLSDDFVSTMREIEDSAVTDTAMSGMTDVRIDDNNQLLGPTIPPVETATEMAIDTAGSPSISPEYQTAMPSPTIPTFPSSRSRSDSKPFIDASAIIGTSSKRSSAYFSETPDDDDLSSKRRRRCESHQPSSPSSEELSPPPPSPTTARAAESIRRSGGARPQTNYSRCRSHSLPDQTTISRLILEPSKGVPLQHATPVHQPKVPLIPSLSDNSAVFGSLQKRRIRDRPIPPPITRASLRELETSEIIKNAQLIHDVIHDPSLQFRPNLEGPRGERKRLLAEEYWAALEREVDRLKVCLQKDPSGLVKLSSNRFPLLFSELRDILCSLLPLADRAVVEEVIDPEFLCQQLFRGVLDVGNLSRFLARTMKEHCAPMRDCQIEKMVQQLELAKESGETSAFVLGLRMVFELLEGMKLDVANHQLRTMKKELQDRAVANEREYFEERISRGKFNINQAINWVKPSLQSENSSNHFGAFSKAFLNILSPLTTAQIPSTFLFDIPRLTNFRKDFRDLISVQLCLLLFRELAMSLHPRRQAPLESAFNALRLEIWAIISDLPDRSKYALAAPSLAVQIALRASQHAMPATTIPSAALVNTAQRWIETNIEDTSSKVFSVAENRVQGYFLNHLISAQGDCIPQTPLRGCDSEGQTIWALGTETAMWLLAERMHRVAAFHWVVFGDVYVRESCETN